MLLFYPPIFCRKGNIVDCFVSFLVNNIVFTFLSEKDMKCLTHDTMKS